MKRSNRKARRAWKVALSKHIKPGCIFLPEIQHDDWCAIYSPARMCNCNPIRILKDDRGRVLARVEGAGFYDPLEWMEAAQ